MGYIKPNEVVSPKARWHLFEVLLAGDAGGPSYALGTWDGNRCIVFRWNGDEDSPLGNPQSRGLATWIVLDSRLHEAVVGLLPPEKRPIAKAFLGIH